PLFPYTTLFRSFFGAPGGFCLAASVSRRFWVAVVQSLSFFSSLVRISLGMVDLYLGSKLSFTPTVPRLADVVSPIIILSIRNPTPCLESGDIYFSDAAEESPGSLRATIRPRRLASRAEVVIWILN